MSIHISAPPSEIGNRVLMPGDPLRADFFSKKFLKNPRCINNTRGMLAYTGEYNDELVTIMGSGMGQPSINIYVNELINDYNAKEIIRVGTCGAFQKDLDIGDIVLAQSASTDASHNKRVFNQMDFAPNCSFNLLLNAYNYCCANNITPFVGNVLASDSFYNDNPDEWKIWARHGVLAVDMETNALYTTCLKNQVKCLSILTVSDSLITKKSSSSEDREKSFYRMCEMALSI